MTQAQQDKYNSMAITLRPDSLPLDSRRWKADEGYNRIIEAKFLFLAGDLPDSVASDVHHFQKTTGEILGWAGAVGGFAYCYYGAFSQSNSEAFNVTPVLVGVGTCLVGAAIAVIYTMLSPDVLPFGKAQQIARDYNQRLLEK